MSRVRIINESVTRLLLFEAHGFSLIEVTFALSIISFAFMVILSLLPIGLSGVRQAMDSSIERQIAQQIADSLLQTPFSQLQGQLGFTTYYDDQGLVTSGSAQSRYSATTKKAVNTFPGSSEVPAATPLDSSALMLQIQVSVAPSGVGTTRSSEYNILVPNSGN